MRSDRRQTVLDYRNFVLPWRPWRGRTVGDVTAANPDAAFAVAGAAMRDPFCPPLLRRAVGVAVTRRKLALAGLGPRRRQAVSS